MNAKYGEECGIFIANNKVRGGKFKENNFVFRGGIDAINSKSKKNKKIKTEERIPVTNSIRMLKNLRFVSLEESLILRQNILEKLYVTFHST